MFTSFPFAFWRGADGGGGTGFGSNYGYQFDGVDERINVSGSLNLTTDDAFSFSYWFKRDSLSVKFDTALSLTDSVSGSSLRIFNLNSTPYFVLTADDGSRVDGKIGASLGTSGQWVHLVITKSTGTDRSDFSYYVNGVFYSVLSYFRNDLNSGKNISCDTFTIGDYPSASHYFDGRIDDVQFYDFELNSTQVSDIYNSGYITAPTASPVHRWKLGEEDTFSTNWTVKDSIGSLDGTSVNMEEEDRKLGVAYSMAFDGVDEYIDFGNISFPTNLSTPFSIGVWFKQSNNINFKSIFGSSVSIENKGVQIWVTGSIVYLQIRETSSKRILVGTSGKSHTEWNFVLFTYNGNSNASGVSIYLNSVLGTNIVNVNNLSPTDDISGGNILIGKATSGFNVNADIMHASIFNSELSASDAALLYNTTGTNNGVPIDPRDVGLSPTFFAPLVGPNDSFNGTDWTIVDEINGNNGTSVNMEEADKTSDTP